MMMQNKEHVMEGVKKEWKYERKQLGLQVYIL